MDTQATISAIRQFIAKDDLPQALAQLQQLLAGHPEMDEAILQSGRYADLRKRIRKGTIREADAEVNKNRLREGLLDLLREVEENTGAIGEERKAPSAGTTINQQADKIYNIDHIDNANFS